MQQLMRLLQDFIMTTKNAVLFQLFMPFGHTAELRLRGPQTTMIIL